MKKIIKSLFTFTILSLMVNVYAFNKGDTFTLQSNGESKNHSSTYEFGYNYWPWYVTSGSSSYDVYCMDRGKAASNGQTYYVERLLPNFYGDYAILYILNDEESDYELKQLAIRTMVSKGMLNWTTVTKDGSIVSSEDSVDASYSAAIAAKLSCMSEDSSFSSTLTEFKTVMYKNVTEKNKKNNSVTKNTDSKDSSSKESDSQEDEKSLAIAVGSSSSSCSGWDKIKQLLIDSMNYAIDKYNDSDEEETKVEKGPATEQEKADGVVKKIVSVKVNIHNIKDVDSDEEYFKYLGFEVEKEHEETTVTLLGASTEFLETDDEDVWKDKEINEDEDLSKKLDGRKGTIYVEFLVEREINEESEEVTDDYEEDCNVKINFKYKYTTEDGGAVLYNKSYGGSYQRFFLASKGDPIEDAYELDTELCDETTCDPHSTLPQICEDGLEPNEEGNVEYEFREAYNPESGKYNIKKCLLSKNSEDKAGNKYKLEDGEYAEMVLDNDYCEVKCKEDYIFGVPYKKSAESGRYFQISVSLKGEQDCYTTKLDYKKYTEDIVDKQIEIIETYNEWLENYENYTFELEDGDPVTCSNGTCSSSCTGSPTHPDNQLTITHSYNFYSTEKVEEEDKFTLTAETGQTRTNEQYGVWGDNASCTKSGDSCISDASTQCDWEVTPEDDYKQKQSEYEAAIAAAKSKLKQQLEELRQIVDKYNSCAADHDYAIKQTDKSIEYGETAYWDLVYRYNPDIQYHYEEPEPGISTTNWISTVQGLSCEHGMNCDYMYSADALVKAEKCADTTNGKVACKETETILDIDDDTHVSTWYCDGSIDIEYEQCEGSETLEYDEEYHWMVPDEDLETDASTEIHIGTNMSNSMHLITKVDYVHKIASSEGTYNTERVYYNGHDDGDIKIEGTAEHEIENYDIVDGLPVGINTPTGTYYYKLILNNFGTFYSDVTTNGRIYSTLENSLASELREATSVINGGTEDSKSEYSIDINEYACIYDVNQTTCTDPNGTKHYKTECEEGEDWDTCQERICNSNSGGYYCVKEAQGYYVCTTTYYDSSTCESTIYSREEALQKVGCKSGEDCENNYNCCPNCVVECIGQCTITPDSGTNGGSKPNYDFRTVSTGNLFPNERVIGYNWESDAEVYNNSLVARKAQDTIDEITARANNTSSEEDISSTTTSKVEDYTLKVVMDKNMIAKIRDYNKSQESYNNDTMTCYDYELDRNEENCKKSGYTWKKDNDSGKCVMANIFCYSSFIDSLVSGDFGGEVDINNIEGRTKAKEQFSKPYVASGVSNSDSLIVTNDYWTIYTFNTLDVSEDGIPDVGPSWK